MPGDPFKKVMPGDRLSVPAETYNALQDLVKGAKARRFDSPGPGRAPTLPNGMIWVRNDSGNALDRFSVVGLVGSIFNPAVANELPTWQHCFVLSAAAPLAWRPFAVLQQPLAIGEVGRAMIMGVTPAVIKFVGLRQRYAVPDFLGGSANMTRLRSADCGVEILYRTDAAVNCCPDQGYWCYLKMGTQTDEFWARITSASRSGYIPGTPWNYAFEEVRKTTDGRGGWTAVTGGWSGTCYNGVEEAGVLDGDAKARVGAVVKMRPLFTPGGTLEYWFQWEGALECV
jgi:hypothetical protein